MQKSWLLFIGCLICSIGYAQETTVTATHTNGFVEYFSSPGATAKRVYPGMKMDLSGSLRCHPDASVKLLYRGATVESNTQKKLTVAELVGSIDAEGQADFTGRFWNFIHKSVEEGDSPEKLKANHQSFMERTRGSKKGMGTNAYAITALPLASGLLPLDAVEFRWRKTSASAPYRFEMKTAEGQTLALLDLRDTVLTLNLTQLGLDPHGEFEWMVSQGESDRSATYSFKVSGGITATATAKLSTEKSYANADPTEQQLMLAYYLEEMKCYYLAAETYQKLLKADPENRLVRMTAAAFFSRMDMLPEAQQLVR